MEVDADAPMPGPKVIDCEVDGSTGSAGKGMASPGSTNVVIANCSGFIRRSDRTLYVFLGRNRYTAIITTFFEVIERGQSNSRSSRLRGSKSDDTVGLDRENTPW